jgi:hypothetical protein
LQAVSVADALWNLNRDRARQILKSLEQDADFFAASVTTDTGEIFARIGEEVGAVPTVTDRADIIITTTVGTRRTIGVFSLSLSKTRLIEQQRQEIWNSVFLGPLGTITGRLSTLARGIQSQKFPMWSDPIRLVKWHVPSKSFVRT